MWEDKTRKMDEDHKAELDAREANLAKREAEHKTATDDLIAKHNDASEAQR